LSFNVWFAVQLRNLSWGIWNCVTEKSVIFEGSKYWENNYWKFTGWA
jgi:hypothetical protein